MRTRSLIFTGIFAFAATLTTSHAAEPQLQTILELAGDSIDLTKIKQKAVGGANVNRNGFFSDIFYDGKSDTWYALSDRGPGGGLLSYPTRVQRFTIDHDSNGAITGYKVTRTIPFMNADNTPFNGLHPGLLNGSKAVLGNSFDPEGIVVGQGGHMYVADEYGPSIYEFTSSGSFIRAFTPPANLLPREADGDLNFVDGRPTIVLGRQDNRGFEGLAINKSRTKLYGIMQDPLVNEGASDDGRRSVNLRIVEYDVVSGLSTRQFVYQLDTITDINARDPLAAPFSATNQGRSIGASSIYGISDTEFFVLERDNRGRGVDAAIALPTPAPTPLHKRIYKINISGATDVSSTSLAGSNGLPAGVVPVQKTFFLDLLEAIEGKGHWIPEKLEGWAPGPELPGGKRMYLAGTDNDYSVTQTGAGEQFDVCIAADEDGTVTDAVQVALDAGCPAEHALIPALLLSFKGD